MSQPEKILSDSIGSTSTTLLLRVKQQDAEAWRRLVRLYGPLVYHWCRQAGLQQADLSDVFQEVFRSVSQNIGKFRRDRPGDTFRGWLRTITRNKVTDHFRRGGKQPQAMGGSDAQQMLQQYAQESESWLQDSSQGEPQEEIVLLHRALHLVRGDFEDRTWQAFWRTTVDGVPPKEVAAELGSTAAAVRQAKSRVLRRLREEFGDLLE